MQATPQTIWNVPAYLPYVQPPLTSEIVSDAERKIGFKLPEELLDLLRVQNGGYIRYMIPDSVHECISGIGPRFPSLLENHWAEVEDQVSFELEGLVPFDGDGHWHYCLDYRGDTKCPSITYADIECDSEEQVAVSFSDYLSLLRVKFDENAFVLPSVPDVENLRLAIAHGLGVQFEPPRDSNNGYPVHRARGGTLKNPEWIWFSPNLAPRGFVREDDFDYETLRHLMPGSALRYPELPEQSYILSVTAGLRSSLLKACANGGIEWKQLAQYLS